MKKTVIRSLYAMEALSDENTAAVLVSVTTEADITDETTHVISPGGPRDFPVGPT